jgi:hypothetical protein
MFVLKQNPGFEIMKVILDVKDNKASFVMELLKSLPFVKAKALSPYKAKVLGDVREAVEQMQAIKEGKLVARDADELFNEL